jgi:hypothetical protein
MAEVSLLFCLIAFSTILALELIVSTLVNAGYAGGSMRYLTDVFPGGLAFSLFYSLAGSLVFVAKSYRTVGMGASSSVFGLFLELVLIRPPWVQELAVLNISFEGDLLLVVSALFWFIVWAVPAYLSHKVLGGVP